MNEKDAQIDQALLDNYGTAEAEVELSFDPLSGDLDMTTAIRTIQKNERGRQGRDRYLEAIKKSMHVMKTKDMKQRVKGGKMAAPTKQESEEQAAQLIQSLIRGMLARNTIEGMRAEEMIFLGMGRKAKTEDEKKNNPLDTAA